MALEAACRAGAEVPTQRRSEARRLCVPRSTTRRRTRISWRPRLVRSRRPILNGPLSPDSEFRSKQCDIDTRLEHCADGDHRVRGRVSQLRRRAGSAFPARLRQRRTSSSSPPAALFRRHDLTGTLARRRPVVLLQRVPCTRSCPAASRFSQPQRLGRAGWRSLGSPSSAPNIDRGTDTPACLRAPAARSAVPSLDSERPARPSHHAGPSAQESPARPA